MKCSALCPTFRCAGFEPPHGEVLQPDKILFHLAPFVDQERGQIIVGVVGDAVGGNDFDELGTLEAWCQLVQCAAQQGAL